MAVLVLHAALGFLLLYAMKIDVPARISSTVMNSFNIPLTPPPEPEIEKLAEKAKGEEGKSAQPNKRNKAAPLEAPKPKIRRKSIAQAAAMPDVGRANDAGASDVAGPGSGAAGVGEGLGGGTGGDGDGGGGRGGNGDGIAQEPRLISGQIYNRDYPKAASKIRAEGTVVVIYTVNIDGRVSGCSIVKSSRNGDLDDTTCHLIIQRYRYEPARDRDGKPKAVQTMWQQKWWLGSRQ